MAETTPELKRDSTMKVTAEEGAEFLKREGKEDLVYKEEGAGDAKPAVQRDTTIDATVKAAEQILADKEIDADARTRGDQEKIEAAKEESEADAEPPKVPRDNTMVETAKEGKEIIGDEPVGETRAQTKAIQEAEEEEKEEEDPASLKRTHTMAETVAEGEEFLKKQKTSNGDAAEEPAQEAS